MLGVEAAQAEIDACKIEQLVSKENGEKLLQFMRFLFSQDAEAVAFLNAYSNYDCVCFVSIEECRVFKTDCLLQK